MHACEIALVVFVLANTEIAFVYFNHQMDEKKSIKWLYVLYGQYTFRHIILLNLLKKLNN